MNKAALLDLIRRRAEADADQWFGPARNLRQDLEFMIMEEVRLPRLPRSPERAFEYLTGELEWTVSSASRLLSERFPEDFLFYRVGQLEQEIFTGLRSFQDVEKRFAFGFHGIGEKGFERYLAFNAQMLDYGRVTWPGADAAVRQRRILCLLYDQIARLYLKPSGFDRYWVMASDPHHESILNRSEPFDWSGRKDIKLDDLVFFYQTAPIKAITHIGRVRRDHLYNPRDYYDMGVEIGNTRPIDPIPFSTMRTDAVLREWSVIRRQFQGVRAEPIPHKAYNRLYDFLDSKTRKAFNLKPEQLDAVPASGEYATEREFADKVLVPLLKDISLVADREVPCFWRFGAAHEYSGRADFVVRDAAGVVTLIEAKLRILERDLERTVEQAKSYALFMGLPSFVVAAPEGLWVYELERHEPKFVMRFEDPQRVPKDEFRSLLLKLRPRQLATRKG